MPKTLIQGTNENIADVDANIKACRDVVNGQLATDNLQSAAGIVDGQLASPNNVVYRTLHERPGAAAAGLAASTWILGYTPQLAQTGAQNPFSGIFYLLSASYAVGGKTTRLRIHANVGVNATATGGNWTFGLYPVTIAGAAGGVSVTTGTVVAGSTVAISAPAASTVTQGNSGDFVFPADGAYVLGVVNSAILAANSFVVLSANLQMRHT